MSYESLNEKLIKGSKKTLYYVCVVPINASGHVLLGERKHDGIWTTPGGGANEGETPEQAAVRESWEEAGMFVVEAGLQLIGVKAAPNGKPVHCFMYRTNQVDFTVRMDPDKEVEAWRWYSRQELPEGLSRQKNQNRLETINQALMKFFGLAKADMSDIEKGGKGSGVKGHKTSKDAQVASNMAIAHGQMVATINEANLRGHPQYNEEDHAHLKGKGYSDHEIKKIWDRDHKDQKKPVGKVKAPDVMGHVHGDQKTESQKMRDRRHGIKHEEDTRTEAQRMADTRSGGPGFKRNWGKSEDDSVLSLIDKLSKGGKGSGVKGHTTAQQPSDLHPHVASAPAKPINKLQSHLTSLEHGGVMPGLHTESGKPVVNNMEMARAQGYDVKDHTDAMNAHYELAQKTQQMLEKLKTAGRKVPPEGAKIVQFHQKMMKQHMQARQYLEERKKNTTAAIKEKKDNAVNSVKKSITQMGSGLGDRDLDVGSFAQANGQGNAEWMERLYSGMEGYSFGDDPRSFVTNAGILHIAKVDDGIYTGYFTKNEEGLADNAKIRIERITIPELVQLMIAKEWIHNHMLDPEPAPAQPSDYASAMDHMAAQIETQEREAELRALNEALRNPVDVPPNGHMAQKIRFLELIGKLIG